MFILTIIGIIVGIVGGLCGAVSLFYSRYQAALSNKQLDLTRKDIEDRKKKEAEDDSWNTRFEELSRKLLRINQQIQVREPGKDKNTWLYLDMYPDAKLRLNIENFIIKVDAPSTPFLPRKPQPHELRSAAMRETIAQAESEMERFIKEHPFCKQHLYG